MTHTDRDARFDEDAKLSDFERASSLYDPEWLERASCQDMDQDDFFPPENKSQLPSIDVALTCRSCPVRKECLMTIAEFEGNISSGKGLFAGMSPQSRQRVYTYPVEQWADVSREMLTDYAVTKIKAQRSVPVKERRARLTMLKETE